MAELVPIPDDFNPDDELSIMKGNAGDSKPSIHARTLGTPKDKTHR